MQDNAIFGAVENTDVFPNWRNSYTVRLLSATKKKPVSSRTASRPFLHSRSHSSVTSDHVCLAHLSSLWKHS